MGILTIGIEEYSKESHKSIDVECDYKISAKCRNKWSYQYRDAVREVLKKTIIKLFVFSVLELLNILART